MPKVYKGKKEVDYDRAQYASEDADYVLNPKARDDDFTDMGLTKKHKLSAEDTKHILDSAKEYKIRKQKNHK
jgi:hypothetical protein